MKFKNEKQPNGIFVVFQDFGLILYNFHLEAGTTDNVTISANLTKNLPGIKF